AMALALIGALPGLAVGAALPFLIAWGFGAIIPLPLAPALHASNLALALVYGLLTTLAFALWPLGRAHDVSVAALFRDEIAGERRAPRRRYVIATVLVVALLATLAVKLAYDQRIAAIFVAAAAGVFVMLRAVAALLLQSDRGITYADEVPAGSRLVAGEWWQPGETAALVSFEKKIADGLNLKLGDPVTVNVLGRNLTARIANLRTVDWQSLGIN